MLAGTLAASEAGPDLLTPLVMSIRKDWPELVAILNKRLAAITQEEMAEPYRRWFGQGGSRSESAGYASLTRATRYALLERALIHQLAESAA